MLELNTEKKNLSQLVLSHKDNESESKLDKLRYLMERYWNELINLFFLLNRFLSNKIHKCKTTFG